MQTIRFENIHKKFGDIQALNGVNITINKGDVFAFLGHNGAGKTTSLRLILGLLNYDEGNIDVFGLNPQTDALEIKKMCGVLSENIGLYENLTPYDNLKYYANIYGIEEKVYEQRIDELLGYFDILDKKHERIKNFSTGMKKKVGIIRAILHQPEIVLLDEPTNGLDPVAIEKLRTLILKFSSECNTTFIITTHNLPEVEKMCNRVVIMRKGKDLMTDTIANLQLKSLNRLELVLAKPIQESKTTELFKNDERIKNIDITNNSLFVDIVSSDAKADVIKQLSLNDIEILDIIQHDFDLEKLYMDIENAGN